MSTGGALGDCSGHLVRRHPGGSDRSNHEVAPLRPASGNTYCPPSTGGACESAFAAFARESEFGLQNSDKIRLSRSIQRRPVVSRTPVSRITCGTPCPSSTTIRASRLLYSGSKSLRPKSAPRSDPRHATDRLVRETQTRIEDGDHQELSPEEVLRL